MRPALVWAVGIGAAAVLAATPYIRYRTQYEHHKRLREVDAGRFYRAGQLTADGLRDAIQRLGIRTVINVQDEYPDPAMRMSYLNRQSVSEKSLVTELGAHFVFLAPDLRPDRNDDHAIPLVVPEFLKLLDDPAAYPVLLHCRAGLHRTGVLSAVYRMEYDGWSAAAAAAELKGHGFGNSACTAANDYVRQYVLNYRPRHRADRPAE